MIFVRHIYLQFIKIYKIKYILPSDYYIPKNANIDDVIDCFVNQVDNDININISMMVYILV